MDLSKLERNLVTVEFSKEITKPDTGIIGTI
jgi:hypothetical protein